MGRNTRRVALPPLQHRLIELAEEAEKIARKARGHGQSLNGRNYYANKLAELRIDATNAFRELSGRSVGDTSALAELIAGCFSHSTEPKARGDAVRSLTFELSTTWSHQPPEMRAASGELFPLSLLEQTRRSHFTAIGRQMNGCYEASWYDACAVMLRRLLETSIIEAFESHKLAEKITDKDGNYFQLSGLVSTLLAEGSWKLSRNTRAALPKLRDLGHISAHSRYFVAQKSDIERIQFDCRVVVEELLRISKLL